jgi:hypothetical protein
MLVIKKHKSNKFLATHISLPTNYLIINAIHKLICNLQTSLELFESALAKVCLTMKQQHNQ